MFSMLFACNIFIQKENKPTPGEKTCSYQVWAIACYCRSQNKAIKKISVKVDDPSHWWYITCLKWRYVRVAFCTADGTLLFKKNQYLFLGESGICKRFHKCLFHHTPFTIPGWLVVDLCPTIRFIKWFWKASWSMANPAELGPKLVEICTLGWQVAPALHSLSLFPCLFIALFSSCKQQPDIQGDAALFNIPRAPCSHSFPLPLMQLPPPHSIWFHPAVLTQTGWTEHADSKDLFTSQHAPPSLFVSK